jgi:23S rRNA pseudouridine1911/1915/1917 synthase
MKSGSISQNTPFLLAVGVAGAELEHFVALNFPAVSSVNIRKAIRGGCLAVNGRTIAKPFWKLRAGDEITFKARVSHLFPHSRPAPPLQVLYEDADLLIADKPAGQLSHPSPQERSGTLLDSAAQYILGQGNPAMRRPFLLHRLDKDTTGAIALARHEKAAAILTKAFHEQRVGKTYLALTHGVVAAESGEINFPIGATPHLWPRWRVSADGAVAVTRFCALRRFPRHTLLSLKPQTGRTHQIRIHCAYLGHPLVGERVYCAGGEAHAIAGFSPVRQLLHAQRLVLPHPKTGQSIIVTAPWPSDLAKAVAALDAEVEV